MKTLLKLGLTLTLMIGFITTNATNEIYENQKPHTEKNKQFIKVALLLDTSNSMDGLIDQAKAQLWSIVNELSYAKCDDERPNLQIALYEYGNDNLSSYEGYIRQVLGFTNDLDDISKELFSLTTNGGSEFCGQVIQSSLNQLDWGNNQDDLKLVFIAGNEPFNQGKINYKHAATNANEKDVTINTIYCGNYQQGVSTFWKDGAKLTNGDYLAIDHNQKTVHIASPYDDAILELNKRLNNTYIAYGKRGVAKASMQMAQDNEAENYSKANAVGRTISKSSHFYKNSTWDLVDAIEEDKIELDSLDDTSLPAELKGKSIKEIKTYVAKKSKERLQIQKEIQELNTKRRTYIASKQKDTKNGLENAMIQAIKTQAKKKNYQWN
ncbi:VWA domain-containing protein [Flavobacteriaceae bacterium S0825]|uniref:vWA domain-containing protein n=1 Tax=Gaetbulibacter sp. S0825 TaxID=2720084 RepID=UPI00142F8599|nr:vWA domain-containing protein [Gaetbulibacter sp. S0825]MCK0108524.1 VWA domain-containing protein [Flavobacteriaceae bacterium S0825]NIX64160.1 VWA domain-containing protein [Gaetbulibacter sp. S0825]